MYRSRDLLIKQNIDEFDLSEDISHLLREDLIGFSEITTTANSNLFSVKYFELQLIIQIFCNKIPIKAVSQMKPLTMIVMTTGLLVGCDIIRQNLRSQSQNTVMSHPQRLLS